MRAAASIHGAHETDRATMPRDNGRPGCPASKAVSLALDLQRVHRVEDKNLTHFAHSSAYRFDSQGTKPPAHGMFIGEGRQD